MSGMTLDEAINKNIKMAELQERLLSNADDLLKEIVMKYATEYRQLAEWLRELKERRSGGWISCEERLPEESGTYICAAKSAGRNIVTFVKWQPRYKQWDLTGARSYWQITHWQPLPEPPKE